MVDEELLRSITKQGCEEIGGKYVDEEKNTCIGKEGKYTFAEIRSVNFKPHPYMIVPKHLEHASAGIYLDESAIERAEQHGVKCGWKDCHLPFGGHTSEKAAFLKVNSDKDLKDIEELGKFLFGAKKLLEEKKIDGVGFLQWDGKVEVDV